MVGEDRGDTGGGGLITPYTNNRESVAVAGVGLRGSLVEVECFSAKECC